MMTSDDKSHFAFPDRMMMMMMRLTLLVCLISSTLAFLQTHHHNTFFAVESWRTASALRYGGSNSDKNDDDDDTNESFSLDPSETALVMIEYQNEFTTPGGKLHDAVKACMDHTNMLRNSVAMTQAARQAACTIVHCPIAFEPVRI